MVEFVVVLLGVWYVHMCVCARRGRWVFCSVNLPYSFRTRLTLELGWQSASLSQPPASALIVLGLQVHVGDT